MMQMPRWADSHKHTKDQSETPWQRHVSMVETFIKIVILGTECVFRGIRYNIKRERGGEAGVLDITYTFFFSLDPFFLLLFSITGMRHKLE